MVLSPRSGGGTATRACSVSEAKALFLPMINSVQINGDLGQNSWRPRHAQDARGLDGSAGGNGGTTGILPLEC